MKRLLILALVIVVCAIGAGFYYGYFKFTSDSADGNSHLNLTVDKKKMHDDEQKIIKGMESKK